MMNDQTTGMSPKMPIRAVAGEIPANCAGLSLRGVRLAHHLADRGDGAAPFQHHRDDGSRGDVRHQGLEERLALVFRVVRLREGPCHTDHLERDELQPPPLESPDDLADQTAVHRVRLEQDEGAVGRGQAPFFAFLAEGAGASSSGASRLRPFTFAHCPSSHALNTLRPSGESFHARNSAFSMRVTGLVPCFFFAHPTIDVWSASLAMKSE